MKFSSLTSPSPRAKLRLTLLCIFLLFVITLFFDGTEFYNQKKEGIATRLGTLSFLKGIALPEINLGSLFPKAFQLGLDLRGGTHLVYEADIGKVSQEDRGASLEGVRDVVERRVNLFGVSEPVVQTVKVGNSYRVIVELAGVHDTNQAIKLIGETPLLEFKEEGKPEEAQKQLTDEQKKELEVFNAAAEKKAREVLASANVAGADFGALVSAFSDNQNEKEKGGDLGWIARSGVNGFLLEPLEKANIGDVGKTWFRGDEGYSILKLLGKRTEEKEVHARHILICYKGATRCAKEISKQEAARVIDDLKKQATPQNFIELAKKYSTEPGADQRGGDLGWFRKGMMVQAFEEASLALSKGGISDVVQTEFGFHLIYKEDERPLEEFNIARVLIKTKSERDYLPQGQDTWKDTGLTGKQLRRATVDFSSTTNFPEVGLEFNDEGKKLFGEITERNVGKPVAIFLDKEPISIPRVNQAIKDGRAVIQGSFNVKEAKLLAQRLNAGALPVPINLISQQTVGASLGGESLVKSLTAGLIGFLIVALFMILYYRLPGLLAVLALCVYTSIVLAIFKVWPVTLTLSGIAGFILSIGMAVDANILIFERMREELRWGKQLESAIRDGFKRAWTSIRDSNVASLITCAVLFWFSASLIKGFALTLAIGIIVSMFSAIMITRLFLRFVGGWAFLRNRFWLFGVRKEQEKI